MMIWFNNMQRNKYVYLCALVVYVLFLNSTLAQVATPAPVTTENLQQLGLVRNCIAEPVFNGRACLYEINKGAEQTVVLVHGLAAEAAHWYKQIALLKKYYHVVTFDLPGFGHSSRGNELYSPTNYARFIHYVTQKYVGKPFFLIGHSMGGAIALRYSAMYPTDVKRLILADVGGVLHQYSYAKSIAFKWLKVLQRLTYGAFPGLQDMPLMHDLVNTFFQNLDWLPVDVRDALRVPELRAVILNGNSIPIASVAVSTEDFSGAIRSTYVPTLIVWGRYDLVTPIRTGKILEVRMPMAYMKVLARSAHSSMNDQPEEFNKLMLAHFSQTDAEIINQHWQFPIFRPGSRVGQCEGEREKTFTGAYLRIELDNCLKVTIKNASVGSIVAKNSSIEIEKSQIISKDIAITLFDSVLDVTSSNIAANVGIQTLRSHIDVAGVDFKVKTAVVNNFGQSDAVFSVSLVNGKPLHQYKDFTLAGRL